ncbi:hypothetical protein [Candidatus Tokpelaia sp.]|uniref:hypothetical protein n=1 Tax=Candidatus Tokpelaia sp. TaxID=2233777 RepID=UPI001239FCCE|nr:hypothetical protein [Candidatus Tokpelaia sp.]KAA6405054.1 hypothetical protein DPQ22_05680 [Candidatus Tokpelaia sp.]
MEKTMKLQDEIPLWQVLVWVSNALFYQSKNNGLMSDSEMLYLAGVLDAMSKRARVMDKDLLQLQQGLMELKSEISAAANTAFTRDLLHTADQVSKADNVVQLPIVPRPFPPHAWQNKGDSK